MLNKIVLAKILLVFSFSVSSVRALSTESSYNEVRDRVYAEPLQELPFYSRFSIRDALFSILRFKTALMERAGLTVRDRSDLIEPLPKVLHPMGVCASAEWEIHTTTPATGLLSQGTKVPGLVRLSVASNQVTYEADTKRVIAIALKLFPTQDQSQKVRTRNFLTADQTGLDGSTRHSFFFGSQPGEVYFSNAAKGDGFASKLGFILFDRIDGPSNFRPVYQLAEVDATNTSVIRPLSPTELRLVPRITRKIEPLPADFREEIRSYDAGELKFDIVLPRQAGVRNEVAIGTLTLGKPVVSVACDQELHFQHHPMNRSLDLSVTSLRDLQLDGTERPASHRYKNGKVGEQAFNHWEHRSSPYRRNPLFHEVKYFNFASPQVLGAITYMVVSPLVEKQLVLSSNFVHEGKYFVFRKSFPLDCVEASVLDATANFCREGGIQVLSGGRLRVTQATGPIKWDLVFNAPSERRTDSIVEIEFDKTLPLGIDRIMTAFQGWFHWVPTFRNANVTGYLTIDGPKESRTVDINAVAGYHDQHWGVWNPLTQPMRWVHFSGTDNHNAKIDVSLGEFPQNSDPRGGVSLYRNGEKTFFPPNSYRVEILEEGRIPIATTRDAALLEFPLDASLSSGTHKISKKVKVTTTRSPILEMVFETTSAVAVHDGSRSNFVLNEHMGIVSVQYTDSNGRSHAAHGRGFFMETSFREQK